MIIIGAVAFPGDLPFSQRLAESGEDPKKERKLKNYISYNIKPISFLLWRINRNRTANR